MRSYSGGDWADADHAIWGAAEQGTRGLARAGPHTAEGLAEWGRWLAEQRAGGVERWAAWQHLQGHAGTVPVTGRSGQYCGGHFRFAGTTPLRTALHQFALCSLQSSEWARVYYDRQRARGHRHHAALRALGAKWLTSMFVMWRRHVPYREAHHLATMARQQLRQAA